MKRVCVFCGSSFGARPEYQTSAEAMGRALAERGIGLVYGGGRIGLMGVVADAALTAGGKVYGVIPKALATTELGHSGLTELHVVENMHERKALMAKMSDAFVALPGGFGTFEEFCEIVTWAQLGFHHKPCGLLNVAGYFDPLLSLFDYARAEGFVSEQHRKIVLEHSDPAQMIEVLMKHVTRVRESAVKIERLT